MQDQREYPRLNEHWNISYRTLSQGWLTNQVEQTYTRNISGGGICFKGQEALTPDTLILAELEAKHHPLPIIVLARVIRSQPDETGYLVAVEFRWSNFRDNNAQQTIADYIISSMTEIEHGRA